MGQNEGSSNNLSIPYSSCLERQLKKSVFAIACLLNTDSDFKKNILSISCAMFSLLVQTMLYRLICKDTVLFCRQNALGFCQLDPINLLMNIPWKQIDGIQRNLHWFFFMWDMKLCNCYIILSLIFVLRWGVPIPQRLSLSVSLNRFIFIELF